MDETVLFPSPNWFLNSCMAVSSDGWIVYGGPSKSLCVLEPIPPTFNAVIKNKSFKAHVAIRAGVQKIVSVDITPEWPTKRAVLSGTADGDVKQWSITYDDKHIVNLKVSLAHDVHVKDKEEIVGVGYSNETYAVTLGCYGNIVKWDTSSNVVKTYNTFIKGFTPTCMTCSKHALLNVAVGTKQGVVFLIDLNGNGKLCYKVRGHDEDIQNMSFCPQYEVLVRKELDNAPSSVSKRLQVYSEKSIPEVENVTEKVKTGKNDSETPKKSENCSKIQNTDTLEDTVEVEEEDLFDVYKDHEDDEFGHKKYQPEDIYVKVEEEEEKCDFLAECLKLKDDIIKKKEESQPESTIEFLVDALENAHVDGESTVENGSGDNNKSHGTHNAGDKCLPSSVHVHRMLLATIDKNGNIRIWSKSGKQVSSQINQSHNKYSQKGKFSSMSMLWYKPDVLLFFDSRGQLLACDPLVIDSRNKLSCRTIDPVHKRNVFSIVSTAPRVQTQDTKPEDWPIITMAQNRVVTEYSLMEKKALNVYGSCGGFVYSIASCPYDPTKVAISVGDGAVRVWEVDTAGDDDSQLSTVRVNSFWQNVRGKVLTAAWHPTRENMLAYATAESRIGIIDTSKPDKPGTTLETGARGAIYSLCWGEEYNLYASGSGELFMHQVDKPYSSPTAVVVEVEGKRWQISSVECRERGLVVGSADGAVAVMTSQPPHRARAAAFLYTKSINHTEWHPQQVSESNELSPLRNLIAVCSSDKNGDIVILEYREIESDVDSQPQSVKQSSLNTLSGHHGAVVRLAWSPHRGGELLSSSQDGTVRVWKAAEGVCTSIFAGHQMPALGIAWSALPALAHVVMSGGTDCCFRLWSVHDHPAHLYREQKQPETTSNKNKKKKPAVGTNAEATTSIDAKAENNENSDYDRILAIDSVDMKQKGGKKFMLSFTNTDLMENSIEACRILLNKYLVKTNKLNSNEVTTEPAGGSKFLKIFGSINDVNEFLDEELSRRLDSGKDEAWIMLSIFRGDIDKVFEFANQRDSISPYLLSIAPCVSFKYWKTATQMYLAQVDRLLARGEHSKLNVVREYGGPVLRKTATLLSVHDVTAAVETLLQHRMYKEAYVLCRVRHLDSIAEESLLKWAEATRLTGIFSAAAVLFLAAGDLSSAASVLARCDSEGHLSLAAEIAKISGQTTFADHIAEKHHQIKMKNETTETLESLPSRFECLLKDTPAGQNDDVAKN